VRVDRVFCRNYFFLLLDLCLPLWYYIIVKEKVNMKTRISKALAKGKKQGYYKIKAKQMRIKSIIETELEMLDY
jgi:hypothetical protein